MLVCLDIACTSGAAGSQLAHLLSVATAAAQRTSDALRAESTTKGGIDIQRESERSHERPLLALHQWFNALRENIKDTSLRQVITSADIMPRSPVAAVAWLRLQKAMRDACALLQTLPSPNHTQRSARIDSGKLLSQVLASITAHGTASSSSSASNVDSSLSSPEMGRLGSEHESAIEFENGFLVRFLQQLIRIADTLKLPSSEYHTILREGPHRMLRRLVFAGPGSDGSYDKAEALASLLDVDIVRVILNSLDRSDRSSADGDTNGTDEQHEGETSAALSLDKQHVNTALNSAVVSYIGNKCNIMSRLACVVKQPINKFNAALYDYVAALSYPVLLLLLRQQWRVSNCCSLFGHVGDWRRLECV